MILGSIGAKACAVVLAYGLLKKSEWKTAKTQLL